MVFDGTSGSTLTNGIIVQAAAGVVLFDSVTTKASDAVISATQEQSL